MSTSEKSPTQIRAFSELDTRIERALDGRSNRDAALRIAAATLERLDAMVGSGATDAEVNAAEEAYELEVDDLVRLDMKLSVACDELLAQAKTIMSGARFSRVPDCINYLLAPRGNKSAAAS